MYLSFYNCSEKGSARMNEKKLEKGVRNMPSNNERTPLLQRVPVADQPARYPHQTVWTHHLT